MVLSYLTIISRNDDFQWTTIAKTILIMYMVLIGNSGANNIKSHPINNHFLAKYYIHIT